MPPTEIALIIIAVALCILVLILIPTLFAIKRAAVSVGELAEMLQSELKPTVEELTGVLAELKTVCGGVAGHTEDLRLFMSALGETGANMNTINRSVSAVTGILKTTSVWSAGARVAGKYILERFLKKRGGI